MMNPRTINLSPYKEISITFRTLQHSLVNEATIIISDGEEYYMIQDDREKIEDVSQMPNYIKEDWIRYHRKELTTQVLDWHILKYTDDYELKWPRDKQVEEILSLLKSIKRNHIINKIL